jgi:flagellar protein FliO/FliZ
MLELADLSRTIMGLGVVLVLMGVVFWLLRRFGPEAAASRPGGGRRLALVESLAIDPRTRLVLVRQDAREHLIVISSTGSASLVQTAGPAAPGPAGDVA